jgi:oxygen-independent coproporphyrinogen III oxidase
LNKLKTIYIGGGNPSINHFDLIKINNLITSSITLNDLIEYTVESNPVNINNEFIKTLKEIKVDRVSLGIQSFDEKVLINCNRIKQNLINILNALNNLNKNNFNISIDLISGLPKQNIDFELNKLEEILVKYKNINHISFYDLSIEKGSYFYKNLDIKSVDDELSMKYEKLFVKLIKQFGFKKYEVSNYAKKSKYSIHNLTYWKYKNYLGLGPAAHSKIDDLRIENEADLNSYINFANFKKEYKLTFKEQVQEYILMGLRLVEGIDLNEFYIYFNLDFKKLFIDVIDKYSNTKLLLIDEKRVWVSNKGLKILNTILVDFFNELDKRL